MPPPEKLKRKLQTLDADGRTNRGSIICPFHSSNGGGIKISYFIMNMYVVCTQQNRLIEAILMSTHNIPLYHRRSKRRP